MSGQRIGILGGTFDPPHLGHLWLAALAADSLRLDRVLVLPAGVPPHKPAAEVSPAPVRLELTRAAIAGEPLLELSLVDIERPGPSYTVESVEILRARHPVPDRLFLVMAGDSLAQVGTWREPDRLLSAVEWIVGPRAGQSPNDLAALAERFGAAASRIHLLEGPALDISSSEIRERVAAGRTIRYLVPRAVEALIVERGLYRASAARSEGTG